MISKELSQYPIALKDFTSYLISLKTVDVSKVLSETDLQKVIGYYITFVSKSNFYILVGDDNFIIYIVSKYNKPIIEIERCDSTKDIMNGYREAIKLCFKHIQTPF